MSVISGLFGACVVAVVLCTICKAHARRWTILAREYACRHPPGDGDVRRLQTVILTHGGELAYSSYRGIVTATVNESGLRLRLLPPFSYLHPALFIPFDELQIKASSWYLNSSSYRLCPSRASNVGMIVDGDFANWIMSYAPQSCQSWYSEASELDFEAAEFSA